MGDTVTLVSTSTVSVDSVSIDTNYYVGTNGLIFINDILLFALVVMFAFFLALNQFLKRA